MRTMFLTLVLFGFMAAAQAQDPWVVYQGASGIGAGKHVVFISGDEEYRSEEALPQLARIMAKRHGFKCTVLFAYNDRAGVIDPTYNKNIPGLQALETADVMVIFTRFRSLPDDQMQYIDNYLKAGKPVIGIRTSTHAFKFDPGSPWEHYNDGYAGDKAEWTDGFGRLVLGEKWISHHGEHKIESTRGRLAPDTEGHLILRGIKDGEIWAPTDVYGVRLPLPGQARPLVLGEVVRRAGEYDGEDLFFGMRPEDSEPVAAKNDPMMPIAWVKVYMLPGGEPGKVVTSTVGASTDMLNAGVRRLLANSIIWAADLLEQMPAEGANVDLVGEFKPTKYEFRSAKYWRDANLQPADFALDLATVE